MSKSSKKKKVVIEERYHGPLITNGVSLGYIKLLSWISLVVSFMAYFGTTYIDHIGIYKILFILCMFISGVAIPLSFFDRFILRFKSFIYLFVSILVLILNVDMTFTGLIMLVGNDGIYSVWALIYNLSVSYFFLLVFIPGIIFLRIREKSGLSTDGRLMVVKTITRNKSDCLILELLL